MDKKRLEKLLVDRLSFKQIAREFDCSVTNVRYWIARYGLRGLVVSRLYFCDDSVFSEAVCKSFSVAGVLRALNRAITGSGYAWVKRNALRLGLDTSHWKGQSHGKSAKAMRLGWELVLVCNSKHRIGSSRKRRLVLEGLLSNKCSVCLCHPEWMGKPLMLRLDHKNGIRNDNRIDNLRLVCPNCDSQLPTYCGRNLKHKLAPLA